MEYGKGKDCSEGSWVVLRQLLEPTTSAVNTISTRTFFKDINNNNNN